MPFWTVARAEPCRDALAVASITALGFETLWPRVRLRVGLRWRTQPLFVGYLFVRVEDGVWRPITRSLGVASVVRFGTESAKVPDQEIATLIARSDADGVIRLARLSPNGRRSALAPGANVTIAAGPLMGLDAIYQGMSSADRVVVLMNILGGAQRPVEISAGLIAAWA
jgi:transcription antitermination factor NusG